MSKRSKFAGKNRIAMVGPDSSRPSSSRMLKDVVHKKDQSALTLEARQLFRMCEARSALRTSSEIPTTSSKQQASPSDEFEAEANQGRNFDTYPFLTLGTT